MWDTAQALEQPRGIRGRDTHRAHLAPGGEPRQALNGALGELIRLVSAKRLVFVAFDQWGGRIYPSTAPHKDTPSKVIDAALDPADASMYFFPIGCDAWFTDRPRAGRRALEGYGLDAKHRALRVRVELPHAFTVAHRFRSLLVMSAEGADQAMYRLFLLDGPAARASCGCCARLRAKSAGAVQRGGAVAAAVANRRGRTRAGRGRPAPTASSSRSSASRSQVDVWRRTAGLEEASAPGTHSKRAQARSCRFARFDSADAALAGECDHVTRHLARADVKRIRRIGIDARFVSEIARLSLSASVCDGSSPSCGRRS